MKLIVPDYYKDFVCIADRCQHSCCIGWEIDIDPDTYGYYKNIPGEFGDRLRCGISCGDTPCFKLGKDDRCAFLNDNGLCDIILNLGEDSLCDICTEHPRFSNHFSDRIEKGLGLTCEEACRIVLGKADAVRLELLDDDYEDLLNPEDAELIAERDHVLAFLQDRSITLLERFRMLLGEYDLPDDSLTPANWAEFYRGLERLDVVWDKCLDVLADCNGFTVPDGTIWENLAVYIVYRHFADLGVEDSLAFAMHTVRLLNSVTPDDFDGICEVCRMWSSEIEYSDENVNRILDRLFII